MRVCAFWLQLLECFCEGRRQGKGSAPLQTAVTYKHIGGAFKGGREVVGCLAKMKVEAVGCMFFALMETLVLALFL